MKSVLHLKLLTLITNLFPLSGLLFFSSILMLTFPVQSQMPSTAFTTGASGFAKEKVLEVGQCRDGWQVENYYVSHHVNHDSSEISVDDAPWLEEGEGDCPVQIKKSLNLRIQYLYKFLKYSRHSRRVLYGFYSFAHKRMFPDVTIDWYKVNTHRKLNQFGLQDNKEYMNAINTIHKTYSGDSSVIFHPNNITPVSTTSTRYTSNNQFTYTPEYVMPLINFHQRFKLENNATYTPDVINNCHIEDDVVELVRNYPNNPKFTQVINVGKAQNADISGRCLPNGNALLHASVGLPAFRGICMIRHRLPIVMMTYYRAENKVKVIFLEGVVAASAKCLN